MQSRPPDDRTLDQRFQSTLSHFSGIRETKPTKGKLLWATHGTYVAGVGWLAKDTPQLGVIALAVVTLTFGIFLLYAEPASRTRRAKKPPESGP